MEKPDQSTGKLWTKPFLILILTNFLMFMSMYILLPTLPVYAQKIGGSETAAGLIVGIFTLTAVTVRPWFGNMLDLKGRRPVMLGGIMLFLLAVFAFNWAYVVSVLLLLRLFHGVGWGAATTATGTIAADVIPPSRRGEGMGYYGASSVVAMAIGPALGLYVIAQHTFNTLFVMSGILAVLAFIAS